MDTFNWYHIDRKKVNRTVPLCNLNNVQLRFLCPSDVEEVKILCQNWFPIDYPYGWYYDITSNPCYYSLAAIYRGSIIGLIVAQKRHYKQLLDDERNILPSTFGDDTTVGYMLTLGVDKQHRRNGIASLLLDNLILHLTLPENQDCKALFLHVLTTNRAAIHFYEHRNFKLHSFLPYYYLMSDGHAQDGFTYVLYLNGGHGPWGLLDYTKHYAKIIFCGDICRWLNYWMRSIVCWMWPGMRKIVCENSLVSQYS